MSAPEDETALVGRAVGGDAEALEEVVRRVQDPVYRLALRMAGRPADAEDAAQEILIRVVTRLSSWRAEASLVTWAYRIAVNHLLNLRRTAYEHRGITFEVLGENLAEGLAAADHRGPEAELLAEEVRLGCTQAMLQCLDRSERVAYVLGEIFELPGEQAGWILEISPAAYRKRLERARKRIRAFMSATCGLVSRDAACRCARRVESAIAHGRVDPRRPVFAGHATTGPRPGFDRPDSGRLGAGRPGSDRPGSDRPGSDRPATGTRAVRVPADAVAGRPGAAAVADGARQMRRLHDAATVMRSHPSYAAPRARSEAVLSLLRSGRYPLLSAGSGG
ncbi:sigma-70 family RNA polymerase sigma factor [Planomonospora sp. ID91781]|uniref:sigma-70 family RNA polymerase sigma factor n=1 Tax=Planomonospora sp. ID91781 TaxID=2738135 RepID=UPI0018C3607F|nr:sigma-70 family RNA polymerase sigma factor [Planomonospora sp. ID91781]